MNLPEKSRKNLWLLVAIIFSIGLVYYMLTPLFRYPGHTLLEVGGDGGKNYFTYLFHCLYGKGVWFEGMNYPHGENVIYTDNQPLLSVTISYLRELLHIDMNGAIAIMHVSILLSYIATVVIIYKIFITCSVRPLMAILFSGLIVVMSPQVLRLTGHFALSHAFYIPLLLYWLLKYHLHRQIKYAVYVYVVTVVMTFMHPYYAAISMMMVFLYALGYLLFAESKFKQRLKDVIPVLVAITCSLITIQGIIYVIDPLKDRPLMPYGTLQYISVIQDVFTSYISPVWKLIKDRNWYSHVQEYNEGFAYIGLVPATVMAVSLAGIFARMAISVFDKSKKAPGDVLASWNKICFFIAIAALLLAMGIPFIWHMERLLDYLSLFRQFRSLGRFSWIFYYVMTIGSVVYMARYYSLIFQKSRLLAIGLMILALMTWGYEATGYMKRIREINPTYERNYDWFLMKSEKNWNEFMADNHFKSTDFQAVLILPYTHIGTDKIWVNTVTNWITLQAYKAALQLKLPMIDVVASRSSWSVAEKQVRIAAGPWSDKPVLSEIKSSKPFLLLKHDKVPLDPDQDYLAGISDSIGHFSDFYVFVCYPDSIRKHDSMNYSKIKPVYQAMTNKDTCIAYAGMWYLDHLDKDVNSESIFGNGSFGVMANEESDFAELAITPMYADQMYEISYWALLERKTYRSPTFYVHILDSVGKEISYNDVPVRESVDNDGAMWFRGSKFLALPANCRKITIRLFNDKLSSYRKIDELMIRPADAIIMSKQADGKAMVNNHIYKPQ